MVCPIAAARRRTRGPANGTASSLIACPRLPVGALDRREGYVMARSTLMVMTDAALAIRGEARMQRACRKAIEARPSPVPVARPEDSLASIIRRSAAKCCNRVFAWFVYTFAGPLNLEQLSCMSLRSDSRASRSWY